MAAIITRRGVMKHGTDSVPVLEATAGDTIQATFGSPVSLSGIPQWESETGATPTSATQIDAQTIELVWGSSIFVGGQAILIPPYEGNVRTRTGGYARAATIFVEFTG